MPVLQLISDNTIHTSSVIWVLDLHDIDHLFDSGSFEFCSFSFLCQVIIHVERMVTQLS